MAVTTPIKKQLLELLQVSLQQAGLEVPIAKLHLEHPAQMEHGDFSTNVAMTQFKNLPNNDYHSPRELAQEIVNKIAGQNSKLIQKVELAGPGFINIWLSHQALQQELTSISENPRYGSQPVSNDQKMVVEYSSPNIAKPFTIGHLRSTVIGDAIANLYEFLGFKVYRDNHLGDWGTQFGKQIFAIKNWGDEQEIEQAENPVKKLVELYVKFHQEAEKDPAIIVQGRRWFKKLEDGDPEARGLWKKCIDWSWKEFNKIYKQLGVQFSENHGRGYGESYFEDQMKPVVEELQQKGLLTSSEGAQLVFFPDDKYPPLMILKKDGTTLYATRDLATDKFRLDKYGQDITIVNEVGAEQSLYFKQLFAVEEMLGWVKPGQRVHVGHGLFRFKDKKMSTRKGNVIWLNDVLSQAITKAQELVGENQDLAQQVGLGALKYNDLKRKPHLNVVFDWDEILSMEGNSGPYVQYAHARCLSVLEKGQEQGLKPDVNNQDWNEKELAILRFIYQFPEYVQAAAEAYSPNILVNYLYELAQRYNSFYNSYSILGSSNQKVTKQESQARLALTQATANLLATGLDLLGIVAPTKM